ncbi:alkaline phosphatase family protein [Algoriphagus lacus]|uniref:Alkaline phosphatase family protein n=1 Tax=Algoriphagus lacus TaxID=2056311 RepID=A0A418PW27_9BACT|nr:alkaline phosphatase family protein [Algoriphagus lacus]RIW18368.1 alkaline phosphatase family protein [Algoriphagus lacus]
MDRSIRYRVLLFLAVNFWVLPIFSQEKKVVFIILDGIPADLVERVNTPNLDRIAAEGGYTRAFTGGKRGGYSETPTISAVGYNSLITGTWANKHNVWGNGIEEPNYNYWTIFRFLKEARPEAKTAIFSTWLDNRTKLIGEGLSESGHLELDYHFDGFELDTITYPQDKDKRYILNIDNLVSYEAAHYLKTSGPDLSWVYLEYTDDIAHRFGDSREMDHAVQIADEQVGRIWEAVEYRMKNRKEDWLIFITTDHGRTLEDGKDHGGQSDREREIWMVTNAGNLNFYFQNEKPAMVDILPTISRFMGLKIPQEQEMELDGVPLIGPISITQAELSETETEIILTWKPMEDQGKVEIWMSRDNKFKTTGQPDSYSLLGEVEISSGEFRIQKNQLTDDWAKFLLKGRMNTLNLWTGKD